MKAITVFTPTYNRAYTLHQLYDSLCRQKNKDFEWLILDDGSQDETEQIVNRWINEKIIDVRYFKTQNGGKSRAINKGVLIANGELFFIVDSDDYLMDNAIDKVLFHWNKIEEKFKYSGVCARRIYTTGEKIGGDNIKFDIIDSDNLSFHYSLGINADIAEVFRTDLLRKYPFPEFENEKFVPEAFIWNKITRLYPMRYFNEGIYVCEYLSDGYTKNFKRNLKQNPKGFRLYYNSLLTNKGKIPVVHRIKALIRICQCNYFQMQRFFKYDS